MSCFKAYDVRGNVPEELNPDLAWRIGQAYAQEMCPLEVVVGQDVRLSSPSLCQALTEGLLDGGVNVVDLGVCGTEEIYHATFSQGFDGGIVVTGSHNPADCNGMKFVRRGAVPISGDSGLQAIRSRAMSGDMSPVKRRGVRREECFRPQYVDHLMGYVDPAGLAPLKILANPGNGCAGMVLEPLRRQLPFAFTLINQEPDGTFPNGVPNPLLPERRQDTSSAVVASGADLGIAWDGDFDRCFIFDEKGAFIEGYYLVGLLAESLLGRSPGGKIIHDPRLTWNTIEMVRAAGGVAVESKTGHAFIKERMRAEDAIYGGEMSAHHYFRDFAYCDSGMIPWLLLAALMSASGRPLSAMVEERIRAFPCSGEINRKVADSAAAIRGVHRHFQPQAIEESWIDGLSMGFGTWRFNVRSSNTESLLRVNVESRGDRALMEGKTAEILGILNVFL
ncbi:MAG TPA: phosphomannomutase [Humidesulfovibrio sp.]|uniref:phosphomannomutase n=1 Tax=Humidesulfovibrio sp. TaxID=2910988 RepID=UPI002CB3ECD9|nr:phosphomannomutase [Humidesulfovibrio sp.]HWR04293.1 phosphomannomutase [Humidesulfovibrio sp.]